MIVVADEKTLAVELDILEILNPEVGFSWTCVHQQQEAYTSLENDLFSYENDIYVPKLILQGITW